MKQLIYFLTVIFIMIGCNNAAKEKASADKANATAAQPVNQVVGIGKIEPESDIVQLSSQVSGVVKLINKKENDRKIN